jgi:hypothetical protein
MIDPNWEIRAQKGTIMKKLIVTILFLAAVFTSGCASTTNMNTLKSYPEVGNVLRKQAKVGVVGYPAASLEFYNIKAVEVEKPAATDQASMQSFLREKMIESLIMVDTTNVKENEGGSTSNNNGQVFTQVAMKVVVASLGGVSSGSNGIKSSSTTTSERTKNTITCKVAVYGTDGNTMMKDTSEDVFYSAAQKNEDYAGVVLMKSLNLFRMK